MRNAPRLRFGHEPDSQTIGRELETKLNPWMQQLTALVGSAFTKGNSPTAIINPEAGGAEKFFLLPGRYGGQIAYGATEAEGSLVLGSTAHGTKGLIYLGDNLLSAYDDTADRLGIKTTAPSATLHVVGEEPVTVFWRPSRSIAGAGFALAGGSFPVVMSEVVPDDDTTYIAAITNNPSQTTGLTFNGVVSSTQTFPTPSSDWVLRFRHKKIPVGAVTFNWAINTQSGTLVTSASGVTASTSYATVEVPLSLAQATQIAAAGATELQFVVSGFTGLPGGFSDTNWRLTWIELEIPSTTSAGGGPVAIFQANATQSENNTEWKNSAGTDLISITADGRFTVESGGTMRFVPGAGANKVPVSDADGDLTLTTLTLFGSIFDTTGTAATGDIIYRNASSQWARLAIGTTGFVLKVAAGLPSWVADSVADGDKGDITVSSSGAVWTIDNNVVTYAKMQDVSATARFIGRITAGAGDPEELTGTQATTLLDAFTSALKGLAPASGGGTTNFLRADGTWAAPPGGSIADGDYGDITVSGSGTVWNIDADAVGTTEIADSAVTAAKIANRTRSIFVPTISMSSMVGSVTLGFTGSAPNQFHRALFTNTTDRSVGFTIPVPVDYAGGDIEAFAYYRATGTSDAAGSFYCEFGYLSLADGDDPAGAENLLDTIAIPAATSATTMEIASLGTFSTGVAVGEAIRCRFERDVTEEIAQFGIANQRSLDLIGIRFDYTADS